MTFARKPTKLNVTTGAFREIGKYDNDIDRPPIGEFPEKKRRSVTAPCQLQLINTPLNQLTS